MEIKMNTSVTQALAKLSGLVVSDVVDGGTVSDFTLCLGEPISGRDLVSTLLGKHPSEIKHHYPLYEAFLVVQSAWRLSGPDGRIAGSHDELEEIVKPSIRDLEGKRVLGVKPLPEHWDMLITLSDNLELRTFACQVCDVMHECPHGDIHVALPEREFVLGPGDRVEETVYPIAQVTREDDEESSNDG